MARWLAEKKPDVLVFCFNDHATTFLFDLYPTFALGVSDLYEGAEVIMWLIMRGALEQRAKKVHQSYYLPMTTAMAVALFE